MSRYAYEAMDVNGRKVSDSIEAYSEACAGDLLRGQGLFVTKITNQSFVEKINQTLKTRSLREKIRGWFWPFMDEWHVPVIAITLVAMLALLIFFAGYESQEYQRDLYGSWQRVHGKMVEFEDWNKLRRERLLPGQRNNRSE